MTTCSKCQGNGELEVGTHQDRISGLWDTETVRCSRCGGTGQVPPDFWCDVCGDWMPVFVDVEPYEDMEPGAPFCNRCGEVFTCGECGYEIDLAGNCQRPEGHEIEGGSAGAADLAGSTPAPSTDPTILTVKGPGWTIEIG